MTVAVSGGQVTLSGQTFSWTEREQAANAAWSALGITGVENQIRSPSPPGQNVDSAVHRSEEMRDDGNE